MTLARPDPEPDGLLRATTGCEFAPPSLASHRPLVPTLSPSALAMIYQRGEDLDDEVDEDAADEVFIPAPDIPVRHVTKSGKPTIQDLVRDHGHLTLPRLTAHEKNVLHRIGGCRTPAMGGHVNECNCGCGYQEISYNSCGDRHCSTCGYGKRRIWLLNQLGYALEVPYFHVVFTIPADLNPLFMSGNRKLLLKLLYDAAWGTIKELCRSRHKGMPGAISMNHTWSSSMTFHPHLHMIVPGVMLRTAEDGTQSVKVLRANYLLPNKVLRLVFRGKFIAGLRRLYRTGELCFSGKIAEYDSNSLLFDQLIDKVARKTWIIDPQGSFTNPLRMLRYLCNYTNRMAISDNRIKRIEDGRVYFMYKVNRAKNDKKRVWRETSLTIQDFLQRLVMHISDRGFVRIRAHGFLANGVKKKAIPIIRDLIAADKAKKEGKAAANRDYIQRLKDELEQSMPAPPPNMCPSCNKGEMERITDADIQRNRFYRVFRRIPLPEVRNTS